MVKRIREVRNKGAGHPDTLRILDEERERTKTALRATGQQSLDATTAILFNTIVRPITGSLKGKAGNGIHEGGVDSVKQISELVGDVLKSAGRAARWGIIKSLAK